MRAAVMGNEGYYYYTMAGSLSVLVGTLAHVGLMSHGHWFCTWLPVCGGMNEGEKRLLIICGGNIDW